MVVKMKKNNVRDRVIKVLKNHPEGLITVEIAEKIGMTRQSIAKYVYQLLEEGMMVYLKRWKDLCMKISCRKFISLNHST